MNLESKFYSIKELVSRGLGSESKIKRLVSSGKIKSFKVGRSRLIAESDVNKYIISCQR